MFFAISMFSIATVRSTLIHLDFAIPIVGISLSGYLLKTTLMAGVLSPKRCVYLKFLAGCIFDMSMNKRMTKNMIRKNSGDGSWTADT
jgi:hypothetical protein